MPPKSRGQARRRAGRVPYNGPDTSTEEVFDIISIGSESETSSVIMTGQRRVAHGMQNDRKSKLGRAERSTVPDVFHDMLAETLASEPAVDTGDTPRKKRKLGQPGFANAPEGDMEEVDDDGDLQFEDVIPRDLGQTAYDSDEDSEEVEFEDVGITSTSLRSQEMEEDGDLHLDLRPPSSATKGKPKRTVKVFSKAERIFHLWVHKLHVLCLLRHVDIRNDWCNDSEVQNILSPLVSDKLRKFFDPQEDWSQFRKADSLKRGLDQLTTLWQSNFKITARGMRRSFWAADEKDLESYKLASDFDPPLNRNDFRNAAKKLEGSRDIGAQLYCALLRSVGVEARLICSLQPLPLLASSKGFPKRPGSSLVVEEAMESEPSDEERIDINSFASPFSHDETQSELAMPFSARRRLGHPHAADYHMPETHLPIPKPLPKPKRKRIHESIYPVFWVEVLDEAHQKWMPVDPLVTQTINKSRVFEPPASDIENSMTYVFAFEGEGTARDVTRRYTKWFLAKTRRNRVESTEGGEKWLRRTLRFYSRGWTSDLDQIEDIELATAEGREGMPTSIADFKDHPRYVLERDLKRNEILLHRHEVGKVASGRDPSSPGSKKLENVFRRSDVRTVKSADGWYRLGRDIKVGQQPVKTRPATSKRRAPINEDDDLDDEADTQLYTMEQTELYVAPPVINGRVPRNRYGNIDVYVSSMIPKGGVHIEHPEAAHAAGLLGVDYASAVTGFEFKARRGRAVVKGIVVAQEYQEAIESIIDGFRDEVARAEEEIRAGEARMMWRKFLIGLRVKARIDTYWAEGQEPAEKQVESFVNTNRVDGVEMSLDHNVRDVQGHYVALNSGDGDGFISAEGAEHVSGGFVQEAQGGGFMPDDDDIPEQEDDDEGMESEEYYVDGDGGYMPDDDFE